MDLDALFERASILVLSNADTASSYRQLCQLCNEVSPHPIWKRMAVLDVRRDLHRILEWGHRLLTELPPPDQVRAFWFGLMDDTLPDGTATTLLCLAGSEAIDPRVKDFEWNDTLLYCPDHHPAPSHVLAEIAARADELFDEEQKHFDGEENAETPDSDWEEDDASDIWAGVPFEPDEDDDEDPTPSSLLSYVLTLGYGALAAKHLCRRLDRNLLLGENEEREVIVGFPEGDAMVIGTISAIEGWIPAQMESD